MNDQPWHDSTGTAKLLGLAVHPDGHVTMQVSPTHTNRQGKMHGGLISTVLDTAMGATASAERGDGGTVPFSTLTLTVNFIAPMPLGELRAHARVQGGGFKTVFMAAEARDATGTLIATATGTFKRAPLL